MIRTILFYLWFWVSLALTIPIVVPYLLLMALGLHRPFTRALHAGARLWAGSVVRATGSRVTVEGADNVPREGGVCMVGNHQGSLEVPIVLATLPRAPGFVAKREALFTPILNLWIIALGGVFIHRGNARKAMKAIDAGVERLKAGGIVLVYPEGTRSRGDRIGEFKHGSFKLATKAGVPIVPVTVDGSWHVWEEKRRICPADVRVTMHPAIPTAGLSPDERKALPEKVRDVIASALPGGGA